MVQVRVSLAKRSQSGLYKEVSPSIVSSFLKLIGSCHIIADDHIRRKWKSRSVKTSTRHVPYAE